MPKKQNTGKQLDRPTVGKISNDLLTQESPTRSPFELEQEMHRDYEKHVYDCIDQGKKDYVGDFFIAVMTKRERLMTNVLRNYFVARQSCPTPNYEQAVYKYHRSEERIEFLWVIPDRETCIIMKEQALEVVPEERDLLQFILEFADGTLMRLAQKLNGEII